MALPVFMGEVPHYEIVAGHMHITVGDFAIAMPVNVFLVGCAKGRQAIVEWEQQRTSGEVVRFPFEDTRAAH